MFLNIQSYLLHLFQIFPVNKHHHICILFYCSGFPKIRKLRFFQPREYITLDYSRQDGAIFRVGASNQIEYRPLAVEPAEPLEREMAAFVEAVEKRTAPRVSGEDGRRALAVGLRIVSEMEAHARVVAATIAGQGL